MVEECVPYNGDDDDVDVDDDGNDDDYDDDLVQREDRLGNQWQKEGNQNKDKYGFATALTSSSPSPPQMVLHHHHHHHNWCSQYVKPSHYHHNHRSRENPNK